MTTLRIVGILIANLPEVLRLIRLLEKRAEERATNEQINKDFKTIGDAFEKNDAEALRALFNS